MHLVPVAGFVFLGILFLDAAVLDLARRGITERAIGQRDTLDVLNIILSQTDSVTHYYGPDSHEMADALFRLDHELGKFFDDLDDAVGTSRWLCVLTADHSMARIAEHRLAPTLAHLAGVPMPPGLDGRVLF